MSVTFYALHQKQFSARFIFVVLVLSLAFITKAIASPGAHGPNGEHLDTRTKVAASINPKFESFTETFELAGELLENQLVIYLHDFKTNTPISDASIDLELGEMATSAEFSAQQQAYIVTEQTLLKKLKQAGLHEIVMTILTEDNGDLLVANLENHQAVETTDTHENAEHDDHHHDFPWLIVLLCIGVFVIGLFVGRLSKERK
ncbi:hypothetical protein [Pseudoalteromonas phenolica]|uniref:Uncharacterized protein n=1 Tax=Pseudoalteromonas phenolica TaxID=161398 RepID=A0A0S2K797_9GAMM|nr:hypothetical protein [Pseudoalteromonas phenolica]ALO44157.1 hypothetical protein PP2015_3684 [Pseudoalteromonas phenolica]MBE0357145.1 hypothetical protein [Pseudoalteromonas phenolica O-BC30]RXE97825.1 hypothetical protein D9981_10665 [Pseudoalteromonas phenolica O-BC30]